MCLVYECLHPYMCVCVCSISPLSRLQCGGIVITANDVQFVSELEAQREMNSLQSFNVKTAALEGSTGFSV